jgi:hypothetical protein
MFFDASRSSKTIVARKFAERSADSMGRRQQRATRREVSR